MLIPNLPGKKVQLRMAPVHRVDSLKKESEFPNDAIKSAVLVLLYPIIDGNSHKYVQNGIIDNNWEVLVIERSTYNGAHSAQIAFPGGKQEPLEDNPEITAKREVFEELGIKQDSYTILGELTHIYIPTTNFVIYPVLAVSNYDTPLILNNKEVAGYKRVTLGAFSPTNIKVTKVLRTQEYWSEAPSYIIDNYIIWGATAMILSELYQLMVDARVRISLSKPYISSSNVEI